MIQFVIRALGTIFQRVNKGSRKLRNQRTSGDQRNYSIIKIDQNTVKSPGDLSERPNSSERPSASTGVKNSQRSKIIIIIIIITVKSRNNQDTWRNENLRVLGNIRSGHHRTRKDERKINVRLP